MINKFDNIYNSLSHCKEVSATYIPLVSSEKVTPYLLNWIVCNPYKSFVILRNINFNMYCELKDY